MAHAPQKDFSYALLIPSDSSKNAIPIKYYGKNEYKDKSFGVDIPDQLPFLEEYVIQFPEKQDAETISLGEKCEYKQILL